MSMAAPNCRQTMALKVVSIWTSAIVGQLSSCAPIHRRSCDGLLNSTRPVETGRRMNPAPQSVQIIVYQVALLVYQVLTFPHERSVLSPPNFDRRPLPSSPRKTR